MDTPNNPPRHISSPNLNKRLYRINISVDGDEKDELRTKARRFGMSLAGYLRFAGRNYPEVEFFSTTIKPLPRLEAEE